MLYTKEGYPNEGDVVMCNVTSVQFHSVFVKLTEFHNKSGMIHISEISPGRIRNIRDYVTEGKVIVCKVLRVKKDRDHIDLSLRRINENQRKIKVNSMKQEQIAEKIIEFVAKEEKITKNELFLAIKDHILNDHDTIYEAFEMILDDENYLKSLGISKKYADALTKVIKDRIKPPIVSLRRELSIHCFENEGVLIIQKLLKKEVKDTRKLYYQGGGKYILEIQNSNYKDAEAEMAKICESIKKNFSKTKTTITITQ